MEIDGGGGMSGVIGVMGTSVPGNVDFSDAVPSRPWPPLIPVSGW